ncbi:MAG TPA: helix-turn-helix domain-containing protein [Povalibacter sp.]|nr:helix-turn-helix domain-containing protein [Povalibacter sp.]
MIRCVFTDFDKFADSVCGVKGRYVPLGRSIEDWWIAPVQLGRLWLQEQQVGAPATFAGDGKPDELTVAIPLTDPTAIRINGEPLDENGFILMRHNRPFMCSALEVTRWASITLPLGLTHHVHFNEAAEQDDVRRRADAAALRGVTAMVELFCGGEDRISIVAPASLALAEQEIQRAIRQLLRVSSCTQRRHVGRPRVDRDEVLARCIEFVRENVGQPILVGELSHHGQISERTLRNVFHGFFGVGPVRFMKACQLQEVRSALLNSSSLQDTVTAVARRFGVWDFSLLARNYRAMYGESPSQTLRGGRLRQGSPLGGVAPSSMQTWMTYASRRFVRSGAAFGAHSGRNRVWHHHA